MSRPATVSAMTLVIVAATADSVLAAMARPFTWGANLTTGVAIAGTVLIGLAGTRLHGLHPKETRHLTAPHPPPPLEPDDPPPEPAAGGLAAVADEIPTRGAVATWGLLACLTAIFELLNYLQAPRTTHPTISSLLDGLTGHEALRGLVFVGWLFAGWWIWRRR